MSLHSALLILMGIKPPKDRGEDFDVHGWSGGNIDDAYSLGYEDGRRELAAEMREALGEDYYIPGEE